MRSATVLSLLSCISLSTAAICYFPDGHEGDDTYQTCPNAGGKQSMCCASKRDNPSGGNATYGPTSDTCLPNGMCMNISDAPDDYGNYYTITAYWRDLCTTTDWSDGGGCLNVCTAEADPVNGSDSIARMTPCNGKSNSPTWCCGKDNYDCCNTTSAISIDQLFGASSTSTTSSPTSSPTSTPSTSTSSPPPSPSPTSLSSGLSVGTKAAMGVGCASAIIIIFTFMFVLLRRRQRMKNSNNTNNMPRSEETPPPVIYSPPLQKPVRERIQAAPSELGGTRIHEISARSESTNMRHELDG